MDNNFAKQALSCLMNLIENPFIKKHYYSLSKLYRSQGFTHEADAWEYLINEKFNEKTIDNMLPNKKQ